MQKTESAFMEKLEILTGRWTTSDFIYPGFVGPGGRSRGQVEFVWEMAHKWLAYTLKTRLPGAGNYEVRGRMGYSSQTGYYQTVSWNSMNRMYACRGEWDENETLTYHLLYPRQKRNIRIFYRKISDYKVHKWLEMEKENGNRTTGYEMIFSKVGHPEPTAGVH